MKLRSFFISAFFIRSILVVSVFLLIFIASVSYKHTKALTESTELLVHSYKIEIKLEQLLSSVKDAETGQRGFIISRDSIFLEPYISGLAAVRQPFLDLKSLTVNNVQQYYNVDSLMSLINLRFNLLAISLQLIAQPEVNAVALDENLRKGKTVMDKIRLHINKMTALEDTYFLEHEKKYSHELSLTPLSTLFLILFSLLVFILAFFKINNDLLVVEHTNADLRLTTESFIQAEEIGNFSSWQWHIDSNQFVFSDNLYGLLGVKPQSFKPTFENFVEFVHPDDRNMVSKVVELGSAEKSPPNVFYRIIRKDGELRYFNTVAKLTDFHDKEIFIGITSDVTEQYINNISLEERNNELEKTNKELASFNHIASHDLQEPLRKIQTFLSRFSENDLKALSETGRDYFDKIQTSAKQMRRLINDLLLFSRSTRTEKNFEETDLNELIEGVKQELLSDIDDKNALISNDRLPKLNVIPFQIHQLFLNLLGNSLKYIRQGVSPVIKIGCEIVDASDDTHISSKKYYRISVTDNGMGFEQKYAENIFVLFYRLHQKNEFPGSGIGLSICKKIAENHNGFMTAEGRPDEGATFSLFLPQ